MTMVITALVYQGIFYEALRTTANDGWLFSRL